VSETHPRPLADEMSDDTDTTVRLLRIAGPRPATPEERFASVRGHVRAHWDASVRRRAVRRRARIAAGGLAAAALVLLFVRITDDRIDRVPNIDKRVPPATATAIAWVAKIGGPSGNAHRAPSAASAAPAWQLAVDDPILQGETVETGDAGRLALRFADNSSLRLDVGSRARLVGQRVVELLSGAVYVDTDRAAGQFEIRTPLGTARDIGTQFEVRLIGERVRLRVRTGIVELAGRSRSSVGRAGTEILVSPSGEESRPVAPFGGEWAWTADTSPTIDIEKMPLSRFLERLAREQGWTVEYVDSALAREAGGIILHGSVAGLTPAESLEVTIGTSGLAYRLDNGRLVVFRESSR
jgi:FecR protein